MIRSSPTLFEVALAASAAGVSAWLVMSARRPVGRFMKIVGLPAAIVGCFWMLSWATAQASYETQFAMAILMLPLLVLAPVVLFLASHETAVAGVGLGWAAGGLAGLIGATMTSAKGEE